MKNKAALAGGPDGLNAVLSENFDFGPAGRFGQAVDDGLGGVGNREHAAIRLGL
jgi:hypothetical protein